MFHQVVAQAATFACMLGLAYLLCRDIFYPKLANNISIQISEIADSVNASGSHPGIGIVNWYGHPERVGPSPYDFVPTDLQPGKPKTKLLFLLDFKDYLERMNSHSYEL